MIRVLLASVVAAPFALAQAVTPDFPVENPPSPDKALLGKFLFWEEQMSGDNTMACGTCHIPELGGSDPRSFDLDSVHPGFDGVIGTEDDVRGSKGVVSFDRAAGKFVWESTFFPGHQVTGRKAPTVINAALFSAANADVELFWDGRASLEFVDPQTQAVAIASNGALESQVVRPPTSAVEMGGLSQTWDAIAQKLAQATPLALASDLPADMAAFLAQHPTYPDMFALVFGTPEITARRIAFAIADYERTLISDRTPMDLQFEGIQDMPPELQPGLGTFMNACHVCHNAPLTMDFSFHNLGIRPDEEDIGRAAVTGDPDDRGKFKTPNLKNVALRMPVFHNGGAETLEDVVDFYDQGGGFDTNGLKDGILHPLNLSPEQKADLVLFLEQGLTDPRVENGLPPFDRPTLGSEALARSVLFGCGTPGAGGVEPKVLAHHPPNVGNADFLIGVYDAVPAQRALFGLALAPAPCTPSGSVNVNLDSGSLILFKLKKADANGVATMRLNIPSDPSLAGLVVYAAWICTDPFVPGKLSSTKGVEVRIF